MAPRVSVVIPTLNESAHIEKCVRSVLAQDVQGGLEVLVVDGRSSDGTAEIAERLGARVLANDRRGIPAALNLGLEAAQGEVVVRFDGHAEMPAGFIDACLRALEEEHDAASVGGWREARGDGPWGHALSAALALPVGVGHPLIWRRPRNGVRRDVDHVPLGCFRTETLRRVGGWREELLSNEDFDLDYRLRAGGGRVVFDPRIWSIYRPRESLGEIARQYWRYGNWKARVLVDAPQSLRPRQVAPPALLATAALTVLPTPLRRPARAALLGYAGLLGVAAARSNAGWRTASVLATMHAAWGSGLVRGLVRELRAR